jgi:aminoglycoside 6'-N-acetyltransferase
MTEPIARDDAVGIAIRPMRDEDADYRAMARWLTDERVLEWIYGRDDPWPLKRLVPKYRPRVLGADPVRPCIIEQRGAAVGYIQYYPVTDAAGFELEDATGTWALDMWIGEPELWSTGVGSAALGLVAGYLFEREGAERCLIDPRVENPRAVRAYEKAGFAKVKVLPEHEWFEGAKRDNWLMERRR